MDETKSLVYELLSKNRQNGKDEDLFEAFVTHLRVKEAKDEARKLPLYRNRRSWFQQTGWRRQAILVLLVAMVVSPLVIPDLWSDVWGYVTGSECLVDNNFFVMEMSRPIFDCAICRDISEVPVVWNMTKEEFLQKYAYSDIPVLVKNATANWTAMSTFSFWYFRDLYQEAAKRQQEEIEKYNEKQVNGGGSKGNGGDSVELIDLQALQEQEGAGLACQFFPYKTEFENLLQAFNMSDERAAYKEGEKPWYFGWSNCHDGIQTELRRHYERPYFLPSDSETSSIDWIFMGGRGRGAPMHLDSVTRPSWQAQISGRKTWDLEPPPECLSECKSMSVTVEQGDIFVINTNVWYHGTFVHPGAISICIGSEYD